MKRKQGQTRPEKGMEQKLDQVGEWHVSRASPRNAGAVSLGAARRPEAEELGPYTCTGSAERTYGRLG